MRIGIDCRKILNPEAGEVGGVAHYTHELVTSLLALDHKNEYVLFFDNRILSTQPYEAPNVRIRRFPYYQYKRYLPIAYSHMLITAIVAHEHLDVFHAPATVLPYLYSGRSVITVHDLAIYDHPEWFPSKYLSRQQLSTRMLVPHSVEHAACVIAVSEYTKKDLKRKFHVRDDHVSVIPLGVAPVDVPASSVAVVRKKFDLPERYFLFLGTIEPRKNVAGIVRAFARAHAELATAKRLVIAGGRGWRDGGIFTAIKTANEKCSDHHAVQFIGAVSHEDKLALLAGATAFVWPSFCEGFGLPVLEAMTLGAPVITSNTTSLPEVAGDAALLVDPESEKAIAEALLTLDRDAALRSELAEKGRARAAQFPWRTTAEKTLVVYQEVVSGASPS